MEHNSLRFDEQRFMREARDHFKSAHDFDSQQAEVVRFVQEAVIRQAEEQRHINFTMIVWRIERGDVRCAMGQPLAASLGPEGFNVVNAAEDGPFPMPVIIGELKKQVAEYRARAVSIIGSIVDTKGQLVGKARTLQSGLVVHHEGLRYRASAFHSAATPRSKECVCHGLESFQPWRAFGPDEVDEGLSCLWDLLPAECYGRGSLGPAIRGQA